VTACNVLPVRRAASPRGKVRTSSSSSAVHKRVPGTSVPRALCAALNFRRVSALSGLPLWARTTASTTCAGLGLPLLAAAIFARRSGSPAWAAPFFLALTAHGSRV
jgi:hypothetical protein